MTLMFGFGIAFGDNTTLLFRQLFLKRPPIPAASPIAQPIASAPIQGDPSAERFKNFEAEYLRLRGQLAAGRITRAQLEAALKEMMFQDAQGRWWTMDVDRGRWYVRQGETWVEGNPPIAPSAAAPPPSAQTQSGGCSHCGCLLMGTLILILLGAMTLLAGYVLLLAVT
jgi:hypothetical protein